MVEILGSDEFVATALKAGSSASGTRTDPAVGSEFSRPRDLFTKVIGSGGDHRDLFWKVIGSGQRERAKCLVGETMGPRSQRSGRQVFLVILGRSICAPRSTGDCLGVFGRSRGWIFAKDVIVHLPKENDKKNLQGL